MNDRIKRGVRHLQRSGLTLGSIQMGTVHGYERSVGLGKNRETLTFTVSYIRSTNKLRMSAGNLIKRCKIDSAGRFMKDANPSVKRILSQSILNVLHLLRIACKRGH
jgi:hypothetical protein